MPDYPFGAQHPFYHGSTEPLPDTVLAGDQCRWWHVIDHEDYLSPPWTRGNDLPEWSDDHTELAAEIRTAYGNQVYKAFSTSDNPELRMMAERFGLSGLGSQVGILFVTEAADYVERYGDAHEIDMASDDILEVLYDENASRESWFLVMRAGAPFPLKRRPVAALGGPRP